MTAPSESSTRLTTYFDSSPVLKHVLWVEPDLYVRESLNEFIETLYTSQQVTLAWHSVGSLEEALQFVLHANHPIDVLLLEPDFALDYLEPWLQTLRERYPALQVSLLTQRPVEDYLAICKHLAIHHVVLKSIPFSFDEFQAHLERLCLPHRTLDVATLVSEPIVESLTFHIENSDDIMLVFSSLNELLQQRLSSESCAEICTPLLEGLTNAVYHASKNKEGQDKYKKGSVIDTLLSNETVRVTFLETENHVVVNIQDSGGSLDLERVIYLLARNVSGEGIFDETGRGLFLMYTLMDAFFITVQPQRQTQVTLVKNKTYSLELPATACPYDVTLPNRPITLYQLD